MRETIDERWRERLAGGSARPAVGFDITNVSESDVARVILRGELHGHHLILAHSGADDDVIRLAEQSEHLVLDATEMGENPLSTIATIAARSQGFPGLIWHDALSRPIDFAASMEAAEASDEFVVRARLRSESTLVATSSVVVAIPAYNEAGTIGEVVASARPFADHVLVIDDGSDDETTQRAEAAGATVVRHEENRGYGAALRTAFVEAKYLAPDHLVVIDGDGQHDTGDIPKLVEAQRETKSNVVIGSRFLGEERRSVPLYRRVGISVVNLLTNVGLGRFGRSEWIRDTQSGFRAYDAAAIRSMAADETIGTGMNASTDIIYHARNHGYAISEVGTRVEYDVENGSSQDPISHGIVLVSNLLTLLEQERPITLIGLPGFLTAGIGFAFGYWTLVVTLHSGSVPIGPAISSVFFTLVGVLACFSAIILHSIQVQLNS